MNLHYAAFTYLYEWVSYDRYFFGSLALNESEALNRGEKATPEKALKQLAAMATHYDVIRNLKIEQDGTPRLSKVWNALETVKKPISQEDAIRTVLEFVAALKSQYDRNLVSAATKILWFRFQSPIVIFDSLTKEALAELKGPIPEDYGGFYNRWQDEFSKQEDEIGSVCRKLSGLSGLIEFLGDYSQEALQEAMSSGWFRERVFDHALMNYAVDRRSKIDQIQRVSRRKAVS